MAKRELVTEAEKFLNEPMIGGAEFKAKIGFTGDLYINGKYYRQCIFTPNQAALAIESFLNGEPADGEEEDNDGT